MRVRSRFVPACRCAVSLLIVVATARLGAQAPAAPAPAPPPEAVEAPDPDPWPRWIEGEAFSLRIHPPQIESWNGLRLTGRAAVEVLEKGKEHPVYGVVEFAARTRVDKDDRLVVIDEFVALGATLPAAPERQARLLGFVQQRFNDAVRIVSLDRVETALAVAERADAAPAPAIANEPPAIVLASRPTLLVTVDGEPAWRPIDGTEFERLVNTRPLVLRDAAGGVHLHLFDGWLKAASLAGEWTVASAPSPELVAAAERSIAARPADLLDGGAEEVDDDGRPIPKPTLARGPVPAVLVATEPTELVVVDGEAKWAAIPGTALEYVENTTGNIFRHAEGAHYALLSGRWFRAASLAGPWEFVPQRSLAADFGRIPDDSPKENVKASVAGTPQAREAVIANSIPQTAEVNRAEAKFTPEIDGTPRLAAIEGTPLRYVRNSPTAIVEVPDAGYYAVHNGVWFEAAALAGPWRVAIAVPAVVYTIPAASPVHYVTYVRIYGSTDDVVIVGYTPGYYGTVVADEVIVYGTGYDYESWVGDTWYAYPSTYGYGSAVTYTPWGGWAYSFGVGWAWGYWGSWYGPYYPPYWGPYWGYYPWYGGAVVGPGGGWAAWGPGGWAGTTGNVYRQWGSVSAVSRHSGGYNAWTGNAWRGQVGAAYNSRTGNLAAGQRGAVANVYTGGYAYGGRGAVRDTGSGATVGGGRVTMGNVDSGREVTAGRVGGYDPSTGRSGSAGWVRGDEGGVARIGDDFYAAKDGQVYRRGDDGGWSQAERSGQWKSFQDGARTRDLDRQYQARSSGAQRYQGYRNTAPRGGGFRGGGRRR